MKLFNQSLLAITLVSAATLSMANTPKKVSEPVHATAQKSTAVPAQTKTVEKMAVNEKPATHAQKKH